MNLKETLYHATSDFFYKKIKENGLGTDNIIDSLKAKSFLTQLVEKLDKDYSGSLEWQRIQVSTRFMVRQMSNTVANFQHGQVYFTPSINCAKTYLENRYGSEIITYSFKCVDILNDMGISSEELFNGYEDLLEVKSNPPSKSYILKVTDVPLEKLGTENYRESIEEQIVNLKETRDRIIKGEGDEQELKMFNFRLISPIDFDNIQIEEVKNWC